MIGAHRVENGQASGCERLVYGQKDGLLVVPLEICVDDSTEKWLNYDGEATNRGVIQQNNLPSPPFRNGDTYPLVYLTPAPQQAVLRGAPDACDVRAADVRITDDVELYALDVAAGGDTDSIVQVPLGITGTVAAVGTVRECDTGRFDAVVITMSAPVDRPYHGARVVVAGGNNDGVLLGVLIDSAGNKGWIYPAHLV